MIRVNMYGLLDNRRIQTEEIPIYRTYKELYDGLRSAISTIEKVEDIYQDKEMSFSFLIKLIQDDEDRARLFASIPTMIEDYRIRDELLKHANEFIIKTYLILPYGKAVLIKDFEKIYNNLSQIEELGIKTLKDNDSSKKETFEQFRDRMINMRKNATKTHDIICATTGLAYIYELIDQYIEYHRIKIQNDMIHSIKEIREEQESITNLRNELELVSKQAQNILKEDTDDEFEQCIYNGDIISQEDMIKKLSNHILYKDNIENDDQVFIEDTLEDEYRIDTKKLIIIREVGGGLKITKKK